MATGDWQRTVTEFLLLVDGQLYLIEFVLYPLDGADLLQGLARVVHAPLLHQPARGLGQTEEAEKLDHAGHARQTQHVPGNT